MGHYVNGYGTDGTQCFSSLTYIYIPNTSFLSITYTYFPFVVRLVTSQSSVVLVKLDHNMLHELSALNNFIFKNCYQSVSEVDL